MHWLGFFSRYCVYIKKTKVMCITKVEIRQMKIIMKGMILEQVKEFKYMGHMITNDADVIIKSREYQ